MCWFKFVGLNISCIIFLDDNVVILSIIIWSLNRDWVSYNICLLNELCLLIIFENVMNSVCLWRYI